MAVTLKEQLVVIKYLYPLAPRKIVNNVLVVGTEDGTTNTPQIDINAINFEATLDEIRLNDAKTAKRTEINRIRQEKIDGGMPWDFNGTMEIVQTRDQDKLNLLGINAIARDLIANGVIDPVVDFMPESNTEYLLTPQQAKDMSDQAGLYIKDIYKVSWNLKTAVDAITVDGVNYLTYADAIAAVEAIAWPVV